MSDVPPSAAARVAALRAEFDATFAAAPAPRPARRRLLALRVAGAPYAVAAEQVAGVAQGSAPTPLPRPAPGLLGLVGHRRRLLAAWDLAQVLGLAAPASPRVLVVCAAEPSVGFLVDAFEGLRDIDRGALVPCEGAGADAFAREAAPEMGVLRPVLDLDRALAALRRRAHLEE